MLRPAPHDPSLIRRDRRQVTFEEFWALKSKSRKKRRQRDISITVFKAENVLNAGVRRIASAILSLRSRAR